MNKLVKTLRYLYIKTADKTITKQPSPAFNPNISLISNLGQAKELNQLLNLQSYYSEQLNSRHYAFIARKICQNIKFHQADIKSRQNQILSSEKIPLFINLIQKITEVDVKCLSNDELMNLVFFSQKIIKFKSILEQAGVNQNLIQKGFRQKLLNEINEENRIKKYKFITVQSLLISVGQFLKEEQVIILLRHAHQCLISGHYCSCLHLTLLPRFILQYNRKSKEYLEISTKVMQSCFVQVMNQLKETKEFLTARPLIQIFNIFYQFHKEEMTQLLDVILSKLKEDSYDSTLYAIFFEKQLNIFLTLVKEINPAPYSIKQLIFRLEENRSKPKFKNGKTRMADINSDKTTSSNRFEGDSPKVGLFSNLGKKKLLDRQ